MLLLLGGNKKLERIVALKGNVGVDKTFLPWLWLEIMHWQEYRVPLSTVPRYIYHFSSSGLLISAFTYVHPFCVIAFGVRLVCGLVVTANCAHPEGDLMKLGDQNMGCRLAFSGTLLVFFLTFFLLPSSWRTQSVNITDEAVEAEWTLDYRACPYVLDTEEILPQICSHDETRWTTTLWSFLSDWDGCTSWRSQVADGVHYIGSAQVCGHLVWWTWLCKSNKLNNV